MVLRFFNDLFCSVYLLVTFSFCLSEVGSYKSGVCCFVYCITLVGTNWSAWTSQIVQSWVPLHLVPSICASRSLGGSFWRRAGPCRLKKKLKSITANRNLDTRHAWVPTARFTMVRDVMGTPPGCFPERPSEEGASGFGTRFQKAPPHCGDGDGLRPRRREVTNARSSYIHVTKGSLSD